MPAAFLTTVFFSLSVLFAARSSRFLSGTAANFGRMLFALPLLALLAHCMGEGVGGGAFGYFFISGCVGFGFGDIALFQALRRIGPRLTILLTQCLAAPFAAILENIWLGTTLSSQEIGCGLVILLGVALALAPGRSVHLERGIVWAGIFFGILSAMGQGFGAAISRKAYDVLNTLGTNVDGFTAAYQRMIGGILISGIFYWAARRRRPKEFQSNQWKPALHWMALNGIAGPVIGVGCYQWALSGTPSGVVLPIVAVTPVVTMILVYIIDRDRPSFRSLCGACLAVAGSVALALVH